MTCRRIAPRDVSAASRNDLHGLIVSESWIVGRGRTTQCSSVKRKMHRAYPD